MTRGYSRCRLQRGHESVMVRRAVVPLDDTTPQLPFQLGKCFYQEAQTGMYCLVICTYLTSRRASGAITWAWGMSHLPDMVIGWSRSEEHTSELQSLLRIS